MPNNIPRAKPQNPSSIAPGAIEIKKCHIKSDVSGKEIDIQPIVIEYNVFESMFVPYITGNMVVVDTLALTSVLPIIGQETISLEFKTPLDNFDKSIKQTFRVLRIKDFLRVNERTVKYVIEFMSMEAAKDLVSYISQAFEGPTSKIAQSVFDQHVKAGEKKLKVEITSDKRRLVIPNMSPSETMKFLAFEAKSSQYPTSNYLFFEGLDDFYFQTMDKFIDDHKKKIKQSQGKTGQSVTHQFNFASSDTQSGETDKQKFPLEWRKIHAFKFNSLHDVKDLLISGGIGGTVYGYNPTSGVYTIKTYDKKGQPIQLVTETSNKELFTQTPWFLNHEHHSKFTFIITNEGEQDANNVDDKINFLAARDVSFARAMYIGMDITVPGNSNLRTGNIIKLAVPEFGATDDIVKENNKFINGLYLVLEVKHSYNKSSGYMTSMKIAKNVYEIDPQSLAISNLLTNPSNPINPTGSTITQSSGAGGKTGVTLSTTPVQGKK